MFVCTASTKINDALAGTIRSVTDQTAFNAFVAAPPSGRISLLIPPTLLTRYAALLNAFLFRHVILTAVCAFGSLNCTSIISLNSK